MEYCAYSEPNPLQLNIKLLEGKPIIKKDNGSTFAIGTKTLESREGFKIIARGSVFRGKPNELEKRTIDLEIQDKNTRLFISDLDSNGLSYGDYLDLNHSFANGDKIELHVVCNGINKYAGFCNFSDSKSVYAKKPFNTTDMGRVCRFFVGQRAAPILSLGRANYNEIVESLIEDRTPNINYSEINSILKETEKILPNIRRTGYPGEALGEIYRGIVDLSKKLVSD